MESKEIGYTAVFAALYYSTGIVFQPWSFMAIQVRVACAFIPLIALFGWPATLGLSIGHFAFNLSSPLGFLDFLSPFVFFLPRVAIQRWGVKAMPIHTITVALWVAYILKMVANLPYWPVALTVGIGELLAEWYLGYVLLYPQVEKRL